jgi:LemA protein
MKKFTPLLWAGIILGLVVVVIGGSTAGMGIYAYNGEVTHRRDISQARGEIETSLIGRYEKVDAFIDAIEDANVTILAFLETIRDARLAFAEAISSAEPVDADAAAETIDSTFTQLVAYMEDNPDSYNTIGLYEGYLAEFSASTNAVVYSMNEYNKAVNEYNTFIEIFPNVMFLSNKVPFENYTYTITNYSDTLPTFH